MRPKCDLSEVKVRPRKRLINGQVYHDYVVYLGKVEGRPSSRIFKKRSEADEFVAARKDLKKHHGDSALKMDPAAVHRFIVAEERLRKVNATLEQAVEFFERKHKPVKEVLDLGRLYDRCLLDKELQGVTGHYLATFKSSCGAFVSSRRGRPAESITRDEVKTWVLGNGWAPKTQRGYLTDVRTLFNWAVEEGYLRESPLADGKIKLQKLIEKEPEIYAPEQIEHLFSTAWKAKEIALDRSDGTMKPSFVYRRLVGYLALATFAGVRPHELHRFPVAALDLDSALAALDASVAKTSDRRVLELSENCVAWLRLWRSAFPEMKAMMPPSWDRLLKQLRKVAGLSPWPHDVLRHCFASSFHVTHQDKSKLQAMMGHSEHQDTLDRHYRAIRTRDGRAVTKALAAKFWGILPPVPGSKS